MRYRSERPPRNLGQAVFMYAVLKNGKKHASFIWLGRLSVSLEVDIKTRQFRHWITFDCVQGA